MCNILSAHACRLMRSHPPLLVLLDVDLESAHAKAATANDFDVTIARKNCGFAIEHNLYFAKGKRLVARWTLHHSRDVLLLRLCLSARVGILQIICEEALQSCDIL